MYLTTYTPSHTYKYCLIFADRVQQILNTHENLCIHTNKIYCQTRPPNGNKGRPPEPGCIYLKVKSKTTGKPTVNEKITTFIKWKMIKETKINHYVAQRGDMNRYRDISRTRMQ